MCIAIFKPETIVLEETTLRSCWKNNPHGAGFMFAEDGKLHIYKGFMDYKEFRDAYLPHAAKRMVLHFRIASVGGINPENTHPYSIRSGKLGFVHNGTITTMGGKKGEGKSDTHFFNEEILKLLPPSFLSSFGVMELIENFVGRSRLIFMNELGEVVIVNAETGELKDLVWYSNDSYKASVARYTAKDVEWDEEKQTFVEKTSSNPSAGSSTHGRTYCTADEYWDAGGYYNSCGGSNPPALSRPRMWNEENSPQRNILPLRRVVSDPPKDERLVSLSDLVYSTSKGKWIIKEEESIPKVEECVNCGVALFHEVEFLLGVCGQCETNLVCPNTENCDADLSVEDFIEKQCSNCGQDLDLLKLIEESNRKVTPSQGATGLVSADVVPDFDDTLPFDETPVLPFSRREQGTQDAKEAITVITRLEVERLAEECQMVIVDYELGE